MKIKALGGMSLPGPYYIKAEVTEDFDPALSLSEGEVVTNNQDDLYLHWTPNKLEAKDYSEEAAVNMLLILEDSSVELGKCIATITL